MTTVDLKNVEKIFNSKKKELLDKTIHHGLDSTTKFVEKTKKQDRDSAVKMAVSMQKVHDEYEKVHRLHGGQLPDLHIKGVSTPIAEPSVKITYPNLMNRVFYQGAPIQLTFDTKNVKKPYYCYVFANTSGVLTRLFVSPRPIRFDHHEIPNIMINTQLPVGKHDIFVALYDAVNNSRKKLFDSKGNEVVDSTQRIMGIEIRPPVATRIFTPGTPEAKAEEAKGPKGLLGPHIDTKKANPEIHITNKGDFHKVFAGSDQVPLIFEVKNIQKYTVGIFLQKDPQNIVELDTRRYNTPIVSQSLPIRNLIRKKDPSLNLTEYKSLVIILRDEHGNPLLGGNKLMDSVNISVAPLAISQRSESSTSSNLRLLRPANGDSIPSSGPIDLEFETTLPTPFSYIVNIPKAGGLIHEAQSDYRYAKTQFKPEAKYVDFVKGVKLKKGKFKFELHIYYPANSNTVVATKTIDVNIV